MPWRLELPDQLRSFLEWHLASDSTPESRPLPKVLAVTAFEHDQRFFGRFHVAGNWDFTITGSVPAATRLLQSEAYSLVICDQDIPGWEWKDLLTLLKAVAPRACFLLASRTWSEQLACEVVRYGGYDILPKPLNTDEVETNLRRALHYGKASTRK